VPRKKKLDLSRIPASSLVEFDACTRCGECSIYCPTGGEADEKEERTPRGKLRALKKVIRIERNPIRRAIVGEERLDKMISELARSVYECSICGMCGEACPLSLRTIEMWESVRESLVSSGLGPMENHMSLVRSIENYDNPWMQPRSMRGRWARQHKNILDANKVKVDVLYYVGCTASYDPDIMNVAKNLAEISNAAGLTIGILGQNEKCCGSTLLRLGEAEKARGLAKENADIFRKTGAKKIVTACAGCYKTLYQDYPRLVGEKLPIIHVTQFLEELLRENRLPLKKVEEKVVVTYHDPCHLGRHTKMYDWPRKILAMLPGIELVEMERTRERSRCCGAGGGLKTLDQELVLRIAKKRIEDAERTGASILVTSCPFCEQTLKDAAVRMGGKILVADITDVVKNRIETGK
jgi:heterodisulfide reductase subunit D